jgi:hypothetical protein
MPRWVLENGPTLVPQPIDPKRYKQIIAEVGELLYDYFSQLDLKKNSKGKSTEAGTPQTASRRKAGKQPEDSHD